MAATVTAVTLALVSLFIVGALVTAHGAQALFSGLGRWASAALPPWSYLVGSIIGVSARGRTGRGREEGLLPGGEGS
jgi:hypothetical protein